MLRAFVFLFAVMTPALVSAQTMSGHHPSPSASGGMSGAAPTQPGQAAFASIQEIAEILEADPATDWSRVNMKALRQHLIDMDNVTTRASVESQPVDGGITFAVSGAGAVKLSIQRMLLAHAATMNGVGGWQMSVVATETGARLSVKTPVADRVKLRGLGFIGVLTRGMHHQTHHLMIARGGVSCCRFHGHLV